MVGEAVEETKGETNFSTETNNPEGKKIMVSAKAKYKTNRKDGVIQTLIPIKKLGLFLESSEYDSFFIIRDCKDLSRVKEVYHSFGEVRSGVFSEKEELCYLGMGYTNFFGVWCGYLT